MQAFSRALRALLPALFAAAAVQAAEPARVLVEPPRPSIRGQDLRERGLCAAQILALHLGEWFAADPAVRPVDEVQARAVLGSLLSPAWVRRPEGVHAAASAVVPVDAVVAWEWKGNALELQLHRAAGVTRRSLPWAGTGDTPRALKAAAEFLSSELKADAGRAPFAGAGAGDAGAIEAYYLSQRMRAEWIDNNGVMQLEALQPFMKRLPADGRLAAAIVRSGAALTTDNRAVPNPASGIMMVQQALPTVLGTADEPLAHAFCRINKYKPEAIEADLLGMIARLGQDDVDRALDGGGKEEALDSLKDAGADTVMDALGGRKSPAQQAGAIRCLGIMKSAKALPLLKAAAAGRDLLLKRAAAEALGEYPPAQGAEILEALLADKDPQAAFLAAWSQRRRGGAPGDLAARAEACLKAEPRSQEAVQALAEAGTAAQAALLAGYLEDAEPVCRAAAVRGLLRLEALPEAGVAKALADTQSTVVRAALAALPPALAAARVGRLADLANHPDASLAEAARGRLAELAPVDPAARRLFDLAVEHPYARRRIVDELEAEGAGALLAGAATNRDPRVRAHALARLAAVDAGRARPLALALAADPHRWVRLQAAAVAAKTAGPEDAAAVKALLEREDDEATRLYLQDALARTGGAAPASRPPAHPVRMDAVQVFLCGHDAGATNSPIQGYYDLAYQPDEAARAAHAAGKVFLARANKTAKNPAQVLLNPGWADGFWLGLDEDFGDLAALDGIVLGEESMYFRPYNEWASGWRLFCREAGIDPKRVAGLSDNLTPEEKKAWWDWEQRVAIEGFNVMYDWIKLKYGRLRPGFQVATFMPDQNGPCAYDRRWKFDVAAGYYYQTNNRHRYTQVRRMRTLWPDRPVLWLVDGNPTSGAEAPLNYKYKPLTTPLYSTHMPTWSDALCVWLAGGQPGYFYSKLAIAKDMKGGPGASGVWVQLEALEAATNRALDHMFKGVDEVYRTESQMKALHATQKDRGLDDLNEKKDDDGLAELLGEPGKKDEFTRRMEAEYVAMRQGLLLERRIVWNAARLLSDLPRLPDRHPVLLAGDIRAVDGALRLPDRYDYLDSLNKLEPAEWSRYRVVAVEADGKTALRDGTIRAATEWLRGTAGLLIVRGWLPVENTAGEPTTANLAGRLEADWPWEKDVAEEGKGLKAVGAGAREAGPGLVFWRGAGFKGGVLFDRSDLAPEALREAVNGVCRAEGVGMPFEGPIGMERGEWAGGAAGASCKSAVGTFPIPGADLWTGMTNPALRAGRMGVLVPAALEGRHAAAHAGVAVLSEGPLTVKKLEKGLEVESKGALVQAVAAGPLTVKSAAELPVIDPDKVVAWAVDSNKPGVARLKPEGGVEVVLVRAGGPVSFLLP